MTVKSQCVGHSYTFNHLQSTSPAEGASLPADVASSPAALEAESVPETKFSHLPEFKDQSDQVLELDIN